MSQGLSPYRQFMADLNGLSKLGSAKDFPKMVFFWGTSDYLLLKAQILFKAKWGSFSDAEATIYDADDLRTLDPETLFMQNSFFNQDSLILLAKAETYEKWWFEFFDENADGKGVGSYVFFFYKAGRISDKLKKLLQRCQAQVIACVEPDTKEISSFVAGVAKKHSLDLSAEAQQLLLQYVGNNLSVLENEIKRLALIFAEPGKRVEAKDIESHLGLLKEELVFKLQNFLVKRQTEKAQLLISDLLARGESEFALMGIIARHCRMLLKIANNPQISMAQVGIWNSYQFSDYRTASRAQGCAQKVSQTLELCAKADRALKSTKVSEKLLLAQIVQTLDAN